MKSCWSISSQNISFLREKIVSVMAHYPEGYYIFAYWKRYVSRWIVTKRFLFHNNHVLFIETHADFSHNLGKRRGKAIRKYAIRRPFGLHRNTVNYELPRRSMNTLLKFIDFFLKRALVIWIGHVGAWRFCTNSSLSTWVLIHSSRK